VRIYLVETYVANTRAQQARAAGNRARAAAGQLSRAGIAIRYLRTTFLPDDETCFHMFEASSEEIIQSSAGKRGSARYGSSVGYANPSVMLLGRIRGSVRGVVRVGGSGLAGLGV
jgi:hypothetical protein